MHIPLVLQQSCHVNVSPEVDEIRPSADHDLLEIAHLLFSSSAAFQDDLELQSSSRGRECDRGKAQRSKATAPET